MQKQLSVVGALTLRLLKEHRSPVVSLYDLAIAIIQMYAKQEYAGQKIKGLRASFPRKEIIFKYRNELMEGGILEERKDFPHDCSLLASSTFKDSADYACGIDPICYISHLSAMAYHGLTDRFAKTLFLTTPPLSIWKARAEDRMSRDLDQQTFTQFKQDRFPLLTKHAMSNLNRSSITTLVTKFADQGAYIVPQDRPIRVSSIGRTFLDMLRRPDLCGGMQHVIDVYVDNAPNYLPLIIQEIDRHGDKIDKVRAGYILEERCSIVNNSQIEAWVAYAQRGGSRVLDPTAPYWSTFSQKWCLSINVSN